ncbi:tetratricopeptide repeat protein [bacterium]|nr:tetratricopeptide repeat protein [bacterium]
MQLELDFPEDREFRRLLSRQRNVDVVLASLEIARDAYPQLTFDRTLEWLDRRAAEVGHSISLQGTEKNTLRAMGRCLAGTHGLHGDREAFSRAESSYIHRVIETGVGIPISLSVVYVAVAQRAGIDLAGVASPMHFLARFDGSRETYFVDPFNQGRILKYDRCLDWLAEMTELPIDDIEPMLEPARPRDIIIRMLNNLKSVHVQQDDWEATWKVQRRLTALEPNRFDQRRDLALVAMKSHRLGLAVDLLNDCLEHAPDEEAEEILIYHRDAAERLLSQWN